MYVFPYLLMASSMRICFLDSRRYGYRYSMRVSVLERVSVSAVIFLMMRWKSRPKIFSAT